MITNKVRKHGGTETRRYLLALTLTLFVSMIVVFESTQVFAGVHTQGTIITSGQYSGNEYEMKAWGKDYYSFYEGGGDWEASVIDTTSFRLSGAYVNYVFQVPAELYDHRLIEQFRVTLRHDKTDEACDDPDDAPCDDWPCKLYCYDYELGDYRQWKSLEDTPDGSIKTATVDTWNIYVDDNRHYIGGPEDTNDEYEIYLKIDAPDGAGGADEDDDAEVDIVDISVTLILKQQVPPGLQHTSPVKGTNNKVNVPTDMSTRFTVQVDDPQATGYPIREYHWKEAIATDPAPSPVDDFYSYGGAPEKNFQFPDADDYTIYCKVVYKKASDSTLNRDMMISEVVSIPVRVWNRPTVHDTPPQNRIDAGDVSWYNSKYVGVKGQTVRLMADGETGSSVPEEQIEKFLWDFDNDWSDVELEQPANQVASYTWNNPNENAQIRCKAVTNYGVKSHADDATGKVFELTIYDTVKVDPHLDPGESYTGRVNTSITLKGSLTNSYPGATVEYQWRVNSATPEGELWNDATHKGDYIELTQAVDSQNGQIEYVDLPLSDDWSVTGEFWSGGGTGADAFYIYVWANGTPNGESTDKGQYSIIFDEYTDEMQLYGAPNILKIVAQPIPIDNSEWRPFRVVFYKGKFEVYLDHQLKLEYDDGNNYQARMTNNLFGFGGRTGGQNNYHRVRNMKWTPGDPVDTTSRGEAEYTWTVEGTYEVGLTARVITLDGLVLEETEFAEVRVEAGVPTAMPGGPYRGGIAGGDFSPIQFEGNHPDFVEADDVGKIKDWTWFLSDGSNGALELDGQNDQHVIVGPSGDFPTTAMTVEFWMKSSDNSRSGTPISYASGGSTNDIVVYNYQDFSFYVTGAYTSATGVSATDGKWHHIAAAWRSSDGSFKFYKDGIEVFSDTVATGEAITGGGAFVIGQEQDAIGSGFDPGQAFAGIMDEVMVWNVVRSGDEIRGDMDGELFGNENGLALYWQFEEGKDTTAGDRTNAGNNGSLINMAPEAWVSDGHPVTVHGIWNPVHRYPKAGEYEVGLKVQAGTGKWSTLATAEVEVIPGKVAGYVRAADLRTPVRYVRLILTSSHVDRDALARAAANDDSLHTDDKGGLWTETDANGYYAFSHLPLGSYQIRATQGEGDSAHEFEKTVQTTELTLNAPNQVAIDFVDLSVFPVGGQIVYSIKKGTSDVLVDGVEVTAQPVGSTSGIEALPSTKSLSTTNTNYSLPLFAGKYLFLPKKQGHYVRIKETTPSYDPDTGLVTIDGAKTDIDFIDQTTRKLTVLIEDSGGNPVATYPDSYDDLGGAEIKVTVIGLNGQVSKQPVDGDGKLEVTLNPGEYTITVTKADPEETDVDLRGGDDTVTMTIPVPIELEFVIPEGETTYKPRLFDVPQEFLDEFGITDNPEGYMYYYPPEPRVHTYTIKATANGHSVQEFTLYITDDVSMETEDPAEEVEELVYSDKVKYTIIGGYPNKEGEDEDGYPLAGPKPVKFKATKEGYQDSDTLQDDVIVLGEVPEGTAPKVVSIPIVNYTVLHDPSGDGSYAYLDDSMTIKGLVTGLQLKLNDVEIPVYPSPWSTERKIKNFDFPKTDDDEDDFEDMKDKGLLGYRNSDQALGHFTYAAAIEAGTGAGMVALGPFGYILQLGKVAVKAAAITPVTVSTGIVQYEVSPIRHLETPSGDELPDLLGPGKGDIYFGEGWTLGLQTKYRMGIEWDGQQWNPATETVETYDILDRTNQYIYTIRDIENLIDDLNDTINDPETTDEDEKNKLKNARGRWQKLLNWNLAYKWQQEYVSEDGQYHGDSLDDFIDRQGDLERAHDKGKYELLITSGGPTFEYSRAISASQGVSFGTDITLESGAEISHEIEISTGSKVFGNGIEFNTASGASAALGSSTSYGAEWESGRASEQTVGFVLNDDEIGDSIATRVYADPRWGTPLFFTEPGSITSDPWEPGTNKGIDITLELVEEPTGPFDYSDGAHYKVKMEYTGMRSLDAFRFDFSLFTLPPANPNQAYVEFNGYWGPFGVGLDSELKSAIVDVLITPPKSDLENSGDKQYSVDIMIEEDGDQQIGRTLTLKPTFADLRAPRAVITAPYDGERISPVFFPEGTPFKIEVVSEDTDLAEIQLQIRSKQLDGVWEPWYSLTDMVWEDGGENENVMVVDELDRRPPRREFTFQWSEDKIRQLGVGEYALHAVATDKAFSNQYDEDGNITSTTSTPNTDLDPPSVVFLVDDAKPSVLNSIPDYQARESERIYRGELSVTFTDDMRATDFSDRTFYVTDLLDNDTKVAGYVSYSPALRKTVFVPIVPFQPNGFYRVQIKTDTDTDGDGIIDEQGVHDLAGNPLDNMFMWTFRTTDAPFEPTWSMNWRVTDGIDTDANNITSVEYGGLDDEDEKDVRAVPSLASQMRMCFLNRDKVEFDRDIRPADGRLVHHWFFVVDNVQQGSTVTLEYQPSVKLTKTTRQYQVIRLVEFDQDGNVSNTISLDPTQAQTDPYTGEISFVPAYQYTNQSERSRYFRLDVQKVSFVAGKFEKGTSGWKFLSVPITPQRTEPFVNLGDDIDPFQLFQYDTALGGYKVYPYDIVEVDLQTGHGYFTRLIDDVNVDVGGSSNHDDVTLELDAAGWHAIGNPFILPVDVVALEVNGQAFDAAVASGLVEGTLYRWDIVSENDDYLSENAISDSYEPVTSGDQLNPWDGCWLKTNQANLTLTIPAPADLPDTPPTPDYLKPPMAPATPVEHAASLFAGQFNLTLSLTSDFASDLTTTLGTHQNAKTNWDAFDQSEPPTLSKTVAVYFDHSDWEESGRYNRDIQTALKVGEQRTWKFTVYTDNQDAEMRLSWEKAIAQVPDDIMLYFRRLDTNTQHATRNTLQDMREVQSVDLISHSRITEIPFEVRAERFEMSPLEDLQVIAGEKQVTIKWAANDNTFIDGYVIERTGQEGETSRFELPPTHSLTRLPTHEFVDTDVKEEATYVYQVTIHFKSGAFLHSDLFTVTVLPIIKKTVLLQSYPNPFNPDVWIPYELEKESPVLIKIYNAAGQLVRTLELGRQLRGRYISKSKAAYWNGRTEVGERAASGLYFYVLKTGNFVAMKKMVILK